MDDTRESPGLALIAKLQGLGAQVDYSNPHVPVMPKVRKYSFDMRSVPHTSETLAEYDLVLVATDHDRFDWKLIEENARVIVDTRGRYPQAAGKIYRA
ncbi:UDP binding domain-containing protein [Desulfocurvibacter africanus]|uniref:UDP binding domain-containing protein n=1 Tax=Desulfocurvibacter africanus TaxID=873 RepID=UPI0003115EED|nr:UDP binding domain-containing protein [Desulfocurvibacter africanus]